jgi:hypothetical protein
MREREMKQRQMELENRTKQEAERKQRTLKNQQERAQFKDVDMSKYEEELKFQK